MLRIIEKIILSLIILIVFCEMASAVEKEIRTEIVIKTDIGSADGQIGYKKYEDDSGIEPTAIAIDSKGNIYITDPLNSRIQQFDKNGRYIGKININIKNEESRTKITDLTTDKHGNLYVLSRQGQNIFILDSKGKQLDNILLDGKELAWHENKGWHNGYIQGEMIALDNMGNIYLQTFNALIKFDQKGNVLKKWSRNYHSYLSVFYLDQNDNLYYSQKPNAWDVYDKTGNYLKVIDNANNPYPASCLSPENGCHFPPKYVDAKGNYYYYYLDAKTKDLKAIYKFNKEHKLINKYRISSLDFREEPNMVKFDEAGNLYGYVLNSSKREFSIMKYILE